MAATVDAPALSEEQLADLLALIDGGAEARAFLTQRGIDLSGEQKTKTKKALEFFSKRLQDEGV